MFRLHLFLVAINCVMLANKLVDYITVDIWGLCFTSCFIRAHLWHNGSAQKLYLWYIFSVSNIFSPPVFIRIGLAFGSKQRRSWIWVSRSITQLIQMSNKQKHILTFMMPEGSQAVPLSLSCKFQNHHTQILCWVNRSFDQKVTLWKSFPWRNKGSVLSRLSFRCWDIGRAGSDACLQPNGTAGCHQHSRGTKGHSSVRHDLCFCVGWFMCQSWPQIP